MKFVIIAGSRGFSDKKFAVDVLDRLFAGEEVMVISGGACGADRIGEDWAKVQGAKVARCLPNYEEYGKGAPLVRNQTMADMANTLVLFWDGKSRGSKDMLTRAYRSGIQEIHIYRYSK